MDTLNYTKLRIILLPSLQAKRLQLGSQLWAQHTLRLEGAQALRQGVLGSRYSGEQIAGSMTMTHLNRPEGRTKQNVAE